MVGEMGVGEMGGRKRKEEGREGMAEMKWDVVRECNSVNNMLLMQEKEWEVTNTDPTIPSILSSSHVPHSPLSL